MVQICPVSDVGDLSVQDISDISISATTIAPFVYKETLLVNRLPVGPYTASLPQRSGQCT